MRVFYGTQNQITSSKMPDRKMVNDKNNDR